MRTVISRRDAALAQQDLQRTIASRVARVAASSNATVGVPRREETPIGATVPASASPQSKPALGDEDVIPEIQPDNYVSRLMKYIPAEVVAVFLTVDAAMRAVDNIHTSIPWMVFVICLIATPLYLWRVMKVTKCMQLAISFGAFFVWVLAIGGPFAATDWYSPVYGSVALPIYTLATAIYEG